jgi:hypothetical protein
VLVAPLLSGEAGEGVGGRESCPGEITKGKECSGEGPEVYAVVGLGEGARDEGRVASVAVSGGGGAEDGEIDSTRRRGGAVVGLSVATLSSSS